MPLRFPVTPKFKRNSQLKFRRFISHVQTLTSLPGADDPVAARAALLVAQAAEAGENEDAVNAEAVNEDAEKEEAVNEDLDDAVGNANDMGEEVDPENIDVADADAAEDIFMLENEGEDPHGVALPMYTPELLALGDLYPSSPESNITLSTYINQFERWFLEKEFILVTNKKEAVVVRFLIDKYKRAKDVQIIHRDNIMNRTLRSTVSRVTKYGGRVW